MVKELARMIVIANTQTSNAHSKNKTSIALSLISPLQLGSLPIIVQTISFDHRSNH